jgi:predicted dehydrogenase
VGYGTIGSARARWYRREPRIDLVGVVDPLDSRRGLVARELGNVPAYGSLEEALAGERLDVVDLCSPPVFHEAQIEAAIKNGYDVMCEKPVLTRSAAGVGLRKLARQYSRLVYPIHNYVFSPAMQLLRESARSPAFGALVSGEFSVMRPVAAQGVPEWYPNWRTDPEVAGGGILFDHGTHCIYMAMRLCGRAPTRVACTIPSLMTEGAAEESACLLMDFAGITWNIELSWRAAMRENRYRITGTTGSVDIQGERARVRLGGCENTDDHLPAACANSSHLDWLEPLVSDFIHHLDNGSSGADPFCEAILTTHIIEVAYASAVQGGAWLEIDENLASGCYRASPRLREAVGV